MAESGEAGCGVCAAEAVCGHVIYLLTPLFLVTFTGQWACWAGPATEFLAHPAMKGLGHSVRAECGVRATPSGKNMSLQQTLQFDFFFLSPQHIIYTSIIITRDGMLPRDPLLKKHVVYLNTTIWKCLIEHSNINRTLSVNNFWNMYMIILWDGLRVMTSLMCTSGPTVVI